LVDGLTTPLGLRLTFGKADVDSQGAGTDTQQVKVNARSQILFSRKPGAVSGFLRAKGLRTASASTH
jgi:hypothetical protein